ncbi:DUF4386 domain-containing protein [Chloroflexota bacterium]
MNSGKNIPRLLGAAFLFVFVASLISTQLLTSVVGSGSISDILVNISDNLTPMRTSILVGLVTSVGIVVLAVLLYVVLYKQNKSIALVALGWWLAEAIILAVSKIGAFALIPLSLEFVGAGAPAASYFQTLGDFLYSGIYQQGDNIHMLFYCLGGVLWLYLFYISGYIPRVLSVLGLVIESVGLIGMVLLLLAVRVDMLFFYPIAVLELTIGLWLMVKGIREGSETK